MCTLQNCNNKKTTTTHREKSLQLNTVDQQRQLSQCHKVWGSGHAAHRLEETSSGLRQREAYKRHNHQLPLGEYSFLLVVVVRWGVTALSVPPAPTPHLWLCWRKRVTTDSDTIGEEIQTSRTVAKTPQADTSGPVTGISSVEAAGEWFSAMDRREP